MKILLAEDDPASLQILRMTLEKFGYEMTAAQNGEQAWELIQQHPFPVVVSDWMMPKLDGLDLCKRVRAQPRKEYTYFILLTARSGQEDYHTAMEAGVDDFLTKPLRSDELRIRLRVAERILNFMGQVGELKRLLPICSYCKKIRDDQDYWHGIEAYLHKQTGTDFSHSICPECYVRFVKPQLESITPPAGPGSRPTAG